MTTAHPAHSDASADGVALLSADELRQAVNLWGDTSFDTELATLAQAAAGLVFGLIGQPVALGARTDYYERLAPRMAISHGVPLGTAHNLTVRVTTTQTTITLTANRASGYLLDMTARPPEVGFAAGTTTADTLNALLDTELAHPVTIGYMTGAQAHPAGMFAAKEAVRKAVIDMFAREDSRQWRGTQSGLLASTWAEINRLLAPYSRNYGI